MPPDPKPDARPLVYEFPTYGPRSPQMRADLRLGKCLLDSLARADREVASGALPFVVAMFLLDNFEDVDSSLDAFVDSVEHVVDFLLEQGARCDAEADARLDASTAKPH